MTKNTIIGIDLAKTVFQIGVMSDNKITSNKRVNRKELKLFMTNHPVTTVAMEACYSSHYWAREFEKDHNAKILHSMPGIGVINATALTCKYGNGSQFSNSRGLPVSIGLTPKLNASGNRAQMQGISKRGDPTLRKQLIHGARALLMICDKRPDDALCRWASRLKKRRGQNVAVVAIANRLARLAWVLLNKQEMYRPMPN